MKIFRRLGIIFLFSMGCMMFVIAYDNYQRNEAFIRSEKIKTNATIKVDKQGVKTYHFKENAYGVSCEESDLQAGDQVTIYYQKDKTYMVSLSPTRYYTKKEMVAPIFSGIFLVGFTLLGIGSEKVLRKGE